jgi:hypothetical protein
MAQDHVYWRVLVLVLLNILVRMNAGSSNELNRRKNDRVPRTPVSMWLSSSQTVNTHIFHMILN